MSNIILSAFTLLFYFICCTQLTIGQVIPRELSHSIANPTGIITFDVNQDGFLDVICSSDDDNSIVWYENLQNDTFGPLQYVSKYAMDVKSITNGDIDNDGDLDIVAANPGDGSIMLYSNLGNGSFSQGLALTNSFQNASLIKLADLDNDGWLDIITASQLNDRISWFPSVLGIFGTEILITNQFIGPRTLDIGDIDNDGTLDLVCGFSSGATLQLFKNIGSGVFSPPTLIANENTSVVNLKLFDVDQDLDLDLTYCVGGGNRVTLCYNLGSGVFNTGSTISTPDNPIYIDFVDLNGDLWSDLVISVDDDTQYQWQQNTAGTFGPASLLINQLYAVDQFVLEDFNNDTYPDIVAISWTEKKVDYHKNELGGFDYNPDFDISPQIYYPGNIEFADVDGDNYPDIVFNSSKNDAYVGYFPNNGTADFDTIKYLYVVDNIWGGIAFKNLRIVDIDGDLDNDIVLLSNQVQDTIFWIENDGAGLFSNPKKISNWNIYYEPSFFEAVDIDGDSDIDIISCSGNDDEIIWYKNNGGGTFSTGQTITNLVDGPTKLAIADMDGDLDLDIVSISFNDEKIAWYENLGAGSFGPQQIITITTGQYSPNQLFIRDLDNNGTMDLLIGCKHSYNNNEISWYSNLGGGSFSTKQVISTSVINATIEPMDFDGDGDIDIISRETINVFNAPRIIWLENLGSGNFTSYGPIIQAGWSDVEGNSFCIADVDNDGDQDILNSGAGRNCSIWLLENKWTNLTRAAGKIYVDINQNDVFDGTDYYVSSMQITSSPVTDFSFTNSQGDYILEFRDTSVTYNISPVLLPNWEVTSDSLFYTVTVDSAYLYRDSLDFGIFPSLAIDSVQVELTGAFTRCNETINYWINVENVGTTLAEGVITLQLDDSITFVSSVPIPDSIIGQTIYWNYDPLVFFADTLIETMVLMPDFNSIGDTLISMLTTKTFDGSGNVTFIASDTLNQVMVCAYDPNDKMAEEPGIGLPGHIEMGVTSIDYTVRFQNTGNDTAMVVVIRDQLDSQLDWNSFQPLAFSDPVEIYIDENGLATFTFDNIMLPDSNVNEIASHGFAKYRIKLISGLPAGTVIQNSAEIYFDLNPPVLTNSKYHTLYDCSVQFENLGQLTTPICALDTISFATEVPTTINWNIAGVTSASSSQFQWVADTSGVFNLNIQLATSCPQDSTVQLTVHPAYPLSVLNEISICEGDSVLIFGQYMSTSGVYYDSTQTVFGCDSVITQQLSLKPIPTVNLSNFSEDSLCADGSAFQLAEGTPVGGVYSGVGVINGYFDPSQANLGWNDVVYYYVSSNSCFSSDTASIFVNDCSLGITELNSIEMLVYPNPTKELVNVYYKNGVPDDLRIDVYDKLGRVVQTEIIKNETDLIINLSTCENGIYEILFSSANHINSVKIIKQ